MSDAESSSGGSDAEELARCREAAVPAWGAGQRPRGPEKKRAGRGWVRAVWREGVGSSRGPSGGLVGRRLRDSASSESSRHWVWVVSRSHSGKLRHPNAS